MALMLSALLGASVALGLTVPGAVLGPNDREGTGNTCPSGYDFENGKCAQIAPPISCPTGQHLEGSSCQPDVAPSCPDGFVYTDGHCVLAQLPGPQPPEPDPEPEPAPVVIPFSKLHGVNFIDPVLIRKEDRPKLPVQKDLIEEMVPAAKAAGFNVFRIPVVWESYVGNEASFLAELVALVKTANSHDIFVWIEFHHYFTTSNWGAEVANGHGFPEFIVSCYEPEGAYERDPEVRAFWDDYYRNKIRDSRNSCTETIDVWQMHADFMKIMIEEIDHYPNVIGYEILNEPPVWKDEDYDNVGNMHTAIAQQLRDSTDKIIMFTREIAHGRELDGSPYDRKSGLTYKILPRDPAKNVMYLPHLYNVEDIDVRVSQWKEVQKRWKTMGYDVKIGVGEWSPQPTGLSLGYVVTQTNMDKFVKVWKEEGWMHTYWAFGGFTFTEGYVLVKETGSLTRVGKYYEESIEKFYD